MKKLYKFNTKLYLYDVVYSETSDTFKNCSNVNTYTTYEQAQRFANELLNGQNCFYYVCIFETEVEVNSGNFCVKDSTLLWEGFAKEFTKEEPVPYSQNIPSADEILEEFFKDNPDCRPDNVD